MDRGLPRKEADWFVRVGSHEKTKVREEKKARPEENPGGARAEA